MKRMFLLLLTSAIILTGCRGSDPARVVLDGTELESQLVDGVLMVSGLDLFRSLYGEPIWDQEKAIMGIQDTDLLFLVQADNEYANLNDNPYLLPAAPRRKGSELLVPVEAVVKALGFRVQWDGSTAFIITRVEQVQLSQREKLLVGMWSNTKFFGDMYDAVTGLPVTSSYSGRWYLFREDGSYWYIITGSGPIISGTVFEKGKYRLDGDELVLYSIRSSWYPDLSRSNQTPGYIDKPEADQRLSIEIGDLDKIWIDGSCFYLHKEYQEPEG